MTAVVVLSVVVGYASFTLRQRWLAGGGSGMSYVVIAWSAELLVAVLVIPLCVARLKDIGWSPLLALLVLLSPILSPTLLIIVALNQGETFSAPHWIPTAVSVGSLILFIFLIAMVFWRGESRTPE